MLLAEVTEEEVAELRAKMDVLNRKLSAQIQANERQQQEHEELEKQLEAVKQTPSPATEPALYRKSRLRDLRTRKEWVEVERDGE